MGLHLLQFVHTYGYLAVFAAVTIECLGVPFPGDTALLTAAALAGAGQLNLALVIVAAAAGAIVGDNIGYAIGRFAGTAVVRALTPRVPAVARWLRVGERFFARHGGKTIVIARFVTELRIACSFLAGLARYRWRRFLAFNVAGGVAWATLYGLLAALAGRAFARFPSLVSHIGLALAAAGLVVAVLVVTFGHRHLQRWLLADDGGMGSPAA